MTDCRTLSPGCTQFPGPQTSWAFFTKNLTRVSCYFFLFLICSRCFMYRLLLPFSWAIKATRASLMRSENEMKVVDGDG